MKQQMAIAIALSALYSLSGSLAYGAEETEVNLLPSLVNRSNELIQAYALYEAQLADYESRYGPFDPNLLEPLSSMIELMDEAGDLNRVAGLLTRRLQLVRTSQGLEHADVVPVLDDIIGNEIRLHHWEEVSDRLRHKRDIIGASSAFSTVDLLSIIDDQAYWSLNRVFLEGRDQRVHNFIIARQFYKEAEEIASNNYDENSLEMFPWLYKRALNEYRLVKFLNASGGIAGDTIDRLIRIEGAARLQIHSRGSLDTAAIFGPNSTIPVVDAGAQVGEYYLRAGMSLLADMRDIAELHGEVEATAMAKIYRADFQLLLGLGTSFGGYREAQALLEESGVSSERIDAYFSRPTIIPHQQFFTRFSELEAYQAGFQEPHLADSTPSVHLGVFTAWNESLPDIPQPIRAKSSLSIERDFLRADLSFNVNRRGQVSSVDVLNAEPDERMVRSRATRAVREISFRPALVEGKAVRVKDVELRYLFVEDD